MTPSELLAKFRNVQHRGGGQYMAKCPAHDDRTSSLAISVHSGKALLKCHAECETEHVLRAAGLNMSDLFFRTEPQIVATYDYKDESGTLLYQAVRYDPKDFRQRVPDGRGGWNWKTSGIRRVLYRLPELVHADPAALVFVVEGEKDVDRLVGLGLVATCNVGGAGKWRKEYGSCLVGRNIVILPDNDDPGRQHAQKVATSLAGIASEVRVIELPGLPPKGDVSDWLNAGGTAGDLLTMVQAAPLWSPALHAAAPAIPSSSLPEIRLGPDEMRVVDESIQALASRDNLYQRGGALVEIRESPPPPENVVRPGGGIRAVALPKARLREVLSASANYVKYRHSKDAWMPAHVPDNCVASVEARGVWSGIPALEGVVCSPQFLPDGSILTKPGYDQSSGLYLASDIDFPPALPSPDRAAAIKAKEQLLEVLQDFPLDVNSRAAAIALFLTAAARHAIDGPTPIFAIDANVRGSGKSLFADAVGFVHTGRALPRTSSDGDNAEWRKKITAVLSSAEPLVLVDNVAGSFGCPAIDALLTSRTWKDRLLGVSKMTAELPCSTIWIATGNNMQFEADTARRTLRIGIRSDLEHPEERTGFKHPDLLGWIKQERARLASACTTILRAWHCAGRPQCGLTAWGSFEAWSTIICPVVVWVGLPDPGKTRTEVRKHSDKEATLLERMLAAWEDGIQVYNRLETDRQTPRKGMSVSEAIFLATGGNSLPLLEVFTDFTDRSGRPSATAIGKKLSSLRHRICQGRYFDDRDLRAGIKDWVVECESPASPA